MNNSFEQAFSRLLTSWNRHEELRTSDASFAERADATSDLFNARIEVAQVRRFV